MSVTNVRWHAPFYSGGGYCSEAMAFASSIVHRLNASVHIDFKISHLGDSINHKYLDGLTSNERSLIYRLSSQMPPSLQSMSLSICHSEPGSWHAPWPHYHSGAPCPDERAVYKIGRTMFETDSVPEGWVGRINHYMDEVWVPTEFTRDVFVSQGVNADKVLVVGEPVDTDFYAPNKKISSNHHAIEELLRLKSLGCFLFLFVGKWENRKGIKSLLKAYYEEFADEIDSGSSFSQEGINDSACVRLVILTSAYHSSDDFDKKVAQFLEEHKLNENVKSLPVIISGMPQIHMPDLYNAIDTLVIPSHGEGWGRPHVEAMACAKPVIATNWSGPTAYLTEDNSYPLSIEPKLVPAEGWPGHFWAQPSMLHLKKLMRHVYSHRGEAREKGMKARSDMLELYSFAVMGDTVIQHLSRIRRKLLEKKRESSEDTKIHEL